MDRCDANDRRQVIITATWDYLLRTGLVNASIGDLCREQKLAPSSLYYWFENKDDIWINAGKYGISKVVNALFEYTVGHVGDIRGYFDTLLDEVEKYKHELRIAIQITTSPLYGELMREKSKDFRLLYEKFALTLIDVFKCPHQQAEVFVYSIIAYVIDYVLWDDRDKTQMLLENLYDRVLKRLEETR